MAGTSLGDRFTEAVQRGINRLEERFSGRQLGVAALALLALVCLAVFVGIQVTGGDRGDDLEAAVRACVEEMGPDLEGSASAIEKACRAYALEQQAGGKVTVPEVTPDETPKVPPSETPDGIDVNDEEGSPDTSTSVPSPNTGPEQQPANLPGLASTRGEWDGSHEATGEGEGNFGPVLADGSPRYTILATSEDGRVQSYFLNLPADTASGDVLEAVKAELPDDARPGEVITLEPGCQFHEWTSDVLKEATGRDVVANVGILFSTPDNPTGLVEVMISYEQPGSGFDC